MKYVLGVMAAWIVLGSISASSDEIETGMSLAALNSPVAASSIRDDRAGGDRNVALLKEEEFESPERIAIIESNREDRERIVVIDR
jgi:hypothetical protein